ncbi:MAG: hypothetical protein H0W86_01945 [Armatimonadetes bacterium]|nr:hypothetical protein [Armatimonadota bacterium]
MKFRKAATVAVMVAVVASVAVAQNQPRRQGPSMRGMMGMGLLFRPEVQTELKLTANQRKSLDKMRTDMMAGFRTNNGKQVTPDQRRAQLQKAQAGITKLLTRAQANRLDQLRLQQSGAFALSDPAVAKALAMTAKQKSQLTKIQISSFRPPAPVAKDSAPRRVDRAGLEIAKKKMEAVLSVAQKAKWKAMQGKPFKFRMQARRAA